MQLFYISIKHKHTQWDARSHTGKRPLTRFIRFFWLFLLFNVSFKRKEWIEALSLGNSTLMNQSGAKVEQTPHFMCNQWSVYVYIYSVSRFSLSVFLSLIFFSTPNAFSIICFHWWNIAGFFLISRFQLNIFWFTL